MQKPRKRWVRTANDSYFTAMSYPQGVSSMVPASIHDASWGILSAVHGGADSSLVLDFSTGVSPLPTPPSILRAAREADVSRYPHPTAAPVRTALAKLHDVSPDEIVVGAGSVELIWALARSFAGPGRRGVVLTPAFGEYERALRVGGARVDLVRADSPAFHWRPETVAAALTQEAAVVFICRPSNPCLNALPADLIRDLSGHFARTLFVVDEAYLPLFEDVTPIRPGVNVVVLRSLTKVFALPGLRLGYVLASRSIAAAVQTSLPPWNVSAPAQAAGLVAADLLPDLAPQIREATTGLRHAFERRLLSLGANPEAAGGPFLLYRIPGAEHFSERLAALGIQVRYGASFGLPDHVRVGIRLEAEQRRLGDAWGIARS